MINTRSQIKKIFGLLVLVYVLTLFVFLIDSAKTALHANEAFNLIRENKSVESKIEGLAKDLNRYSRTLQSPILLPPTLLIGDVNSISKLGKSLEHASKAINRVSPLFKKNAENKRLSDIQILSRDSQLLERSSNDFQIALNKFSSVRFSGLLSPLNSPMKKVQTKVLRYKEVLNRVTPIIPILPDLLGNYSKRTYFVAMQNSAQARGTGGLLGTFAIITFHKGKIDLEYVAPNSELKINSDVPIDVPDDYRQIYKDYAKHWNLSNLSPHFPYAAQIWAETWRRMTGQKVDGVISIDTFTLRALLAAMGPIEVSGIKLDSKNVTSELLSNAYIRFESDPTSRKNYLAAVAQRVAKNFINGEYSKSVLLEEMVDPILENRIYLYSSYPNEMKYISRSPLAGILNNNPNNEYRLIIQNIAGNKLDYYLKRELNIISENCKPIRTTKVDFKITNTADPYLKLPAYVNGLRGIGFPNGNKNAQYAGIFLYGPTNSRIVGVQDSDTGETYGWIFTERNRSLYSVHTLIPAGKSKRFTVYFKGGTGKLSSVLQPLVLPQKTTIADVCKN